MADVRVKRATVAGARIVKLVVGMDRLPDRAIDRDTAIRWMRDGHSFVPVTPAGRGAALQLVEVGEGHVIRTDNATVDADQLPSLPEA